jgi:hypothetical protein
LIKAFKQQQPITNCSEEPNVTEKNDEKSGAAVEAEQRVEEDLPLYTAEPVTSTEEQTVSIPGEEDLPARTPTPELLGKN